MTSEEENLTVREIAMIADACIEKSIPFIWILNGPCAISSSHVADQGDGPLYAQDIDDCAYKAIGGACGQLLEQNALPLNKEHANFVAHKNLENIELLSQARSNLVAMRNENTQDKIALYAKIAAMIPTKTIRDVAWRVRLMTEIFLDPSAKLYPHVADQGGDCTYQDLSDDEEIFCMSGCFSPDHQSTRSDTHF